MILDVGPINFAERLSQKELEKVESLIGQMKIEQKPTVNEFLNDIARLAEKYNIKASDFEVGGTQ